MINIYRIFFKYRRIFINVLILISLCGIAFASTDNWRSAFLGGGTGLALIGIGESIAELKKQKIVDKISKLNNE